MRITPSSNAPSHSRALQRASEAGVLRRELRYFLKQSDNEKAADYAKHDAAFEALEKNPLSFLAQQQAYAAAVNFALLHRQKLQAIVARVEALPQDFGAGHAAKHLLRWSLTMEDRPSPEEELVLKKEALAELTRANFALMAYNRTERQLRLTLAAGLSAAQSLELAASQSCLLTEDVLNADQLSADKLPHTEHLAVCDIVAPAFATLCLLTKTAHDLDITLRGDDTPLLCIHAKWFVEALDLTEAQLEQDADRTYEELIAQAKAKARLSSASDDDGYLHTPTQGEGPPSVASASTSWRGSDDDSASASHAHAFPVVNPANGLPMLDGGAIDVAGNVYGTDWS